MIGSIIGAEIRKSGGRYSPCGVSITDDNDFITSDMKVINMYNTDVFCEIGSATIPVYSNLADIPASRLPNRMSVKVTDEAYPSRARWRNTNFRVEYLGPLYPSSPGGSIDKPIGILPLLVPLIPLLIKVACLVVALLVVNAVICTIFNSILAWQLPGGVSGAEREITDTRKLITYPDGSWDVYDTTTGEVVKGGAEPGTWVTSIIVPIVLGVAGIAGIYVFVKYGMPILSKAVIKPKPAPVPEAG